MLMNELDIRPENRRVIEPARRAAVEGQKAKKGNLDVFCGAALELRNGSVVTGKNSSLMHAASSLVLNAIKQLSGIPDEIHLLAPNIMQSINGFKTGVYGSPSVSLDLEETLIALPISPATNPAAHAALEKLKELRGCEVHMTHIPTPGDEIGLRKLGVNLTTDPNFASKALFVM